MTGGRSTGGGRVRRLVEGTAVAYLDRGGASLQLFPAADDEGSSTSRAALRTLVTDGRVRELVIKRVDGEPSPHRSGGTTSRSWI